MVVYVDTTNEPTTDSIDGYTDKVKAFLNGAAPCALLAFGGGCVLDTCKCVGNRLNNPGKAENYQGWELVKNPAPYKIAVPTLSGTGSETSRTGIICNEEKNIKLGMLKNPRRKRFWDRQNALNFTVNKGRVVALMQNILQEGAAAPQAAEDAAPAEPQQA